MLINSRCVMVYILGHFKGGNCSEVYSHCFSGKLNFHFFLSFQKEIFESPKWNHPSPGADPHATGETEIFARKVPYVIDNEPSGIHL